MDHHLRLYDPKLNEVNAELEKYVAQAQPNSRWNVFDQDQQEPAALWASVNSLLSSLNAACSSLQDLGDAFDLLRLQCQDLVAVLHELEEVLMMYAKHSPTDGEAPPIDPMLEEWISQCASTVSNLRGEIEQEAEKQKELEDWDVVSIDDVESIADTLTDTDAEVTEGLMTFTSRMESHSERMKEFLPIIQCDMNDFLGRHLSSKIPRAASPPPGAHGVEHAHHLQPTYDDLISGTSSLRYALYDLSDSIKVVQTRLTKYQSSLPCFGSPHLQSTDAVAQVGELIEQNARILDAITEAQTNHGSEWIDSMLQGKLTYTEYKSLDMQVIKRAINQYRSNRKSIISKNHCDTMSVMNLKFIGKDLESMFRILDGEKDATHEEAADRKSIAGASSKD